MVSTLKVLYSRDYYIGYSNLVTNVGKRFVQLKKSLTDLHLKNPFGGF